MFYIEKLRIKNYRQLSDQEFHLTKGINIIYGENEKGKSSTISSILSLFYADTSTNAKTILDFIQSWGTKDKPILSAHILYNNKLIKLLKDFERKKTFLSIGDKEIDDSRKINFEVSKLIGINSPDIYKSVAVFKGGELSEVSQSGKLKDSLTGISTGEDTNALKAVKNLTKYIDELSKGLDRNVKSPGKIKQLKDSLEEKKVQLNEIKTKHNLYIQSLRQSQSSKESLAIIDQELESVEEIIKKNETLQFGKVEIEKITKDTNSIHLQLEEIINLQNKLESLITQSSQIFPKDFVQNSFEEEYNSLQDNLKLTENKINTTNIEIATLNKDFLKQNDENSRTKLGYKKNFNIGLVLLLFFSISLIPFLRDYIAFFVGISVILFIILIYNIYFRKSKVINISSDELSVQRKVIGELESKLKQYLEQKKMYQEKLDIFLETSKIKSFDEYIQLKNKFADLSFEIKSTDAFLQNKATSNKFEDIEKMIVSLKEQERHLIISKNDIQVATIEKLSAYEISGERFLELEKKKSKLLEERKLNQEEFITSNERSKNLDADFGQILQLEESLYDLESELSFWTNKLNSLKIAEKFLNLAIKATTKGASSKIEQQLKKSLPLITLGRYSDVKVLDDFSIEVFSNERNEYLDPNSSLSTGTVEQIYFLSKIAYLNLLADEQYPPILLDDPFLTFDKDRTIQSFNLLKEISLKNQILFFTCHEEYLPFADNAITL